MAKRISNRTARRLLGVDINSTYRISNRRWLVWGSNYPFVWHHLKPSRSQRANIRHLAIRAAIRERNEQGGDSLTSAHTTKHYRSASSRGCSVGGKNETKNAYT